MINDQNLISLKNNDNSLFKEYNFKMENLRKILTKKFGFHIELENAIFYAKTMQEDKFILNLLLEVLVIANDLDKNTQFLQELNNFKILQEVSFFSKTN